MFGITIDNIHSEVPYLPVAPTLTNAGAAGWKLRSRQTCPAWACFGAAVRRIFRTTAARCVLEQLAPVLAVEQIQFVGIQVPVPEHDQAGIAARPNLLDLSGSLVNFAETAAVIQHLDLIIAVDSAVAHLAGAFGKPVWTLIYKPADWRWLINRPDSPWYATMRLFHQEAMGVWEPVIQRVASELKNSLG